jgi:hypothetical protein
VVRARALFRSDTAFDSIGNLAQSNRQKGENFSLALETGGKRAGALNDAREEAQASLSDKTREVKRLSNQRC